jgi:hypothetical protein
MKKNRLAFTSLKAAILSVLLYLAYMVSGVLLYNEETWPQRFENIMAIVFIISIASSHIIALIAGITGVRSIIQINKSNEKGLLAAIPGVILGSLALSFLILVLGVICFPHVGS